MEQLPSVDPVTPNDHENTLTNINEIIADIEPLTSNYQTYFDMLRSFFKLSVYIFRKKKQQDSKNQSFEDYLSTLQGVSNTFRRQIMYDDYDDLEDDLTIEKKQQELRQKKTRRKANTKKKQQQLSQSSLIQCYEAVPYIFFQPNFVLDFNIFSKHSQNDLQSTIGQLNDRLDLVQINLFSQIHKKFHEYFKVVANFDYLRDSINKNILMVKQTRKRISYTKTDFVDKSIRLRKLIIKRQNIQKNNKMVRIIKSLIKLPDVIKSILDSSLPYQCLQLLQSTRKTMANVSGLKCLNKVQQIIKDCQNTIQISLTKKYTDQLFMYLLKDCQSINLSQKWNKITVSKCLDTSTNMSYDESSMILDDSLIEGDGGQRKLIVMKRQEGKQFQISMLLIQAYRYIDFPVQQGRIKICNFLRVFMKMFEKQLAIHFNTIIQQQKVKGQEQKILQNIEQENTNTNSGSPVSSSSRSLKSQLEHIPSLHDIEITLNEDLVNNLSAEFYVKHLKILNEIFRQIINKYLGYIYTLVIEFQEFIKKQASHGQPKNIQKFKNVLTQEMTLFPTLYKLITDKIKLLLVLKNLSGAKYNEFYRWLNILQFWQTNMQSIIQDNLLSSYNGPLSDVIDITFRKTITIVNNLKVTLNELTVNYVNVYHENVLYNQMKPALQDDSWQSVEIPRQFEEVLIGIIFGRNHGEKQFSEMSLTIMNQSKGQQRKDDSIRVEAPKTNMKVLTNTLLLQGHRYRVTVSMLLICQFIDQYLKLSRLFPAGKQHVHDKLYQLIIYYNKMTNQLILAAKALKFKRIKTQNINAKHICLLSNCLAALCKIITQITVFQKRKKLVQQLEQHRSELHKKLSTILHGKIQSIISAQVSTPKANISQANNSLVTTFLQMFQIIDDYLDPDTCKIVLKQAMQTFMQKYFTFLILKGEEGKNQGKILLQKLRFLKPHFQGEFFVMDKQLQ